MMKTILAHRAAGILYRFIKQYGGCYILPANVCPIVPLTFKLAGVDFEFVDIDRTTLCVDEDTCFSLLSQKEYEGLVFVHTYGTDYNPQQFFQGLKRFYSGFRIIDDKCLCPPDIIAHETYADLTLFSTGYAKYVDLGGGAFGFLKKDLSLSNDRVLYDGSDIDTVYKQAFLRKEKIDNVDVGWLDATVSTMYDDNYFNVVVNNREQICIHKKVINTIYSQELKDIPTLGGVFNNWRYNIMINDKMEVLKLIFENGFFASSHYQPSSGLFVDERYPNAEALYNHVINLFNDKYMSLDAARKLTAVIRNYYVNKGLIIE